MNKLIVIMLIAFLPMFAYGKIAGKAYAPGDTIQVDGIYGVVFVSDQSGKNGKALVMGVSDAEKAKKEKSFAKDYQKMWKKGKISDAEYEHASEIISAWLGIPEIENSNGRYAISDWESKLPSGWRLPSKQDAEDFAVFYCGGIGKDYGIKGTFVPKSQKLTSDHIGKWMLMQIAFSGFICGDSQQDFCFLQRWSQQLTAKDWFQFNEKYLGKEKTVAVVDF